MATAISGLGALTTPVTGDLIEIVDVSDTSMSANGTNKKITFENLLSNWDGWQPSNETWTYASASTFTVSGDVAAKYGVGTRVKFTQTTVKYGVVVSSSYSAPNTTVTIAVNTDYTIANATISSNYYSYASNPVGYPHWFNWTGVLSVSGGTAPTYTQEFLNKFSVNGRTVTIMCDWGNSTGGTAGNGGNPIVLTAPITKAFLSGAFTAIGGGAAYKDGGKQSAIVARFQNASTTNINFKFSDYSDLTGNDQSSTVRYVHFTGSYQI
mgnify:CR=1 FL=1